MLGGQIESGDLNGFAALAQIDLEDNHVDFTKHFEKANAITSVSVLNNRKNQTLTRITAIASQNFYDSESEAYLLMVSHTGDLLQKPIRISVP